MKWETDILVVGGGFFGCAMATHLRRQGHRVILCEKGPDLLGRASYHNQARVHNGYHYPRSILTALRSRVNFPRFNEDFPECIDSSFTHYYAVPRLASKVSARQFRLFMERIGAPIRPAKNPARQLFNFNLIDEVFEVTEYAFDSVRLKQRVGGRMEESGVVCRMESEVSRVESMADGRLQAEIHQGGEIQKITANWVFNCTYCGLNNLMETSGLPRLRLKQEITEMALVEQPDELKGKAVTVMCGPFFSTMPFPPLGCHTLSHVRYTPHCSWTEGVGTDYESADKIFREYPRVSRFEHMRHDAARYVPALNRARQTGSLWEVKTVLPSSEVDDSRPILFKRSPETPNLVCVMGGKIDNIYDVYDELKLLIA
jgi:glycine/D-amino acid oxidase-like deaminating enzyme